jgi:hypothetical protein
MNAHPLQKGLKLGTSAAKADADNERPIRSGEPRRHPKTNAMSRFF